MDNSGANGYIDTDCCRRSKATEVRALLRLRTTHSSVYSTNLCGAPIKMLGPVLGARDTNTNKTSSPCPQGTHHLEGETSRYTRNNMTYTRGGVSAECYRNTKKDMLDLSLE